MYNLIGEEDKKKTFQIYIDFFLLFRPMVYLKGRYLEFRRYHNFANLFSKLSESTFHLEISKFQ